MSKFDSGRLIGRPAVNLPPLTKALHSTGMNTIYPVLQNAKLSYYTYFLRNIFQGAYFRINWYP